MLGISGSPGAYTIGLCYVAFLQLFRYKLLPTLIICQFCISLLLNLKWIVSFNIVLSSDLRVCVQNFRSMGFGN